MALALLPSPGDQFGSLKLSIPVRREFLCAHVAVLFSKEPQSIFPRPLIQGLRMVRDENQLTIVVFDGLFCRKQPWLNLSERNEIVRLVHEDRIAPIDKEMKDHV